jgi:hypothetical protein
MYTAAIPSWNASKCKQKYCPKQWKTYRQKIVLLMLLASNVHNKKKLIMAAEYDSKNIALLTACIETSAFSMSHGRMKHLLS